ncbi:MAG: hypothetical protein LUE91_00580 [Oscillospiraceae bacterium]|nr:hypothetical protein [Oscillospiraceae bacterium]
MLIPQTAIFIGGIVAYVLLLAGSCFLLKRQVTTELFLIIGWAALTFLELDALYALGRCSKGTAVFFLALTAAAAVVSLICYLLYYRLDSLKGYLDGMVPLVLAALVMAAISLSVLAHRGVGGREQKDENGGAGFSGSAAVLFTPGPFPLPVPAGVPARRGRRSAPFCTDTG